MMPGDPLRRELRLFDLVLFNTAAVVGIRWLAAAAHIGPGSLPLWASAAILFFVPVALAVSALSRHQPGEGGLYLWTRSALGEWHGFFCAWCYWLNNVFYLPSLALAAVSMSAYAFGPAAAHWAEDRTFALGGALALLWLATIANVAGLGVGKWLGNLGGASTYLAGAFLLVGGLAAALSERGAATPIALVPQLDAAKLNFWPQIAFAFGGLELGTLLGGEIRNPERTVGRAAWIAGILIALFYMGGTLGMLLLLPPDSISVVSGLAQAGAAAAAALHAPALGMLLALLVTAGVVGQISTWTGGVARLPMVLGADHFLPASFARLHPRWGSPARALIAQAAACTVFLLAMQAGETLRSGYQLLVDMMVITYFIPFLYLFIAAWRSAGMRWAAASGIAVTVVALALSFVPPGDASSTWLFEAKLIAGTALVYAAARWWFLRVA